MSTVEKISIALPRKMAADLKKIVAKGDYSSTSEIIREALRDWNERQARKKLQLENLRNLIKESLASGPSVVFSADDIKRRGREKLATLKKAS